AHDAGARERARALLPLRRLRAPRASPLRWRHLARGPARSRHRSALRDLRPPRARRAARSRERHEAVRGARAARPGRLGAGDGGKLGRGGTRSPEQPRVPRDLGRPDPVAGRLERGHERAHHPGRGADAFEHVVLAIPGPLVVSLYGYELLWLIIALMFSAASILCVTLPPAPPPTEILSVRVAGMAVQQTRAGMSEAFRYLRSTPVVVWSLVYI